MSNSSSKHVRMFTSHVEKLAYAHALIERGLYAQARDVLETMPFNETAQELLGEIGRLELARQQKRLSKSQPQYQSGQVVSIKFAILLLVFGLVMGGVGGFFFGREMLVREVGMALNSAIEDMPTFDPYRLNAP